jgi:hypothetical protein
LPKSPKRFVVVERRRLGPPKRLETPLPRSKLLHVANKSKPPRRRLAGGPRLKSGSWDYHTPADVDDEVEP